MPPAHLWVHTIVWGIPLQQKRTTSIPLGWCANTQHVTKAVTLFLIAMFSNVLDCFFKCIPTTYLKLSKKYEVEPAF